MICHVDQLIIQMKMYDTNLNKISGQTAWIFIVYFFLTPLA